MVTLAGVAPITWAGAYWILSRKGFKPPHLDLVVDFAYLAAACVIGAGVRSPFGESETVAARRLPPFRLAHLAGLTLWALLLLLILSGGWQREGTWLVLVRNLLGLLGMAFFAAFVVGGGLSWILPVGFAVALPSVGRTPGEKWFWWAWTERPAEEPLSWLLAFSLLAAGMGVVSFFGAREAVDEIG